MDKDYVLLFLKKQPSAISHIPQEFFDKHLDVAEAVLKRSGLALEKLSPKIQDNESLVRIAIESSGVGFQYASSRLRNKDELAELVLETRPYAFKYCSDRIRANRGMALRAISKCGVLLPDLVSNGKTFIDDKEAVMAALKQDGSTFQYVGDTLKHDMDLAVIAIAQNPIAVNSLNSKERIQPKIMEALAQKDLFKFSFVIMSLNMEDKEKGLEDFDILLKGKSQEYLLTTIKNASDSRLGNLELNNDFNVCVKMVLKNATKETLEAMKEYSIRVSAVER